MQFLLINVCIITFCMMVHSCFSQDDGRIIFPTEEPETPALSEEEESEIPESVFIQMKDVHNASEFLNQFVLRDDQEVPQRAPASEDAQGVFGINSRRGLSAGEMVAQIAQFATCQPEQQVVKLDKPLSGGVFYWPPCIRVKRCGGCCTSKLLACSPVATSNVNITVLQVRYSRDHPNLFDSEGPRSISVEQHDRCSCGCKELPEHCTELQEYRQGECRCVCTNQKEADQCLGPERFWDGHDCMCKCRNPMECSTGLNFNLTSCRCEIQLISLNFRRRAARTGGADFRSMISADTATESNTELNLA
uniref:U43-Liphistoxin-Lth1a_1 n=1 Tax=Liphistius thaleban TaxID=1905330 RepID=A0A4Q8K4P8_9ARAC